MKARWLVAMALVGTMGFAACGDDDDLSGGDDDDDGGGNTAVMATSAAGMSGVIGMRAPGAAQTAAACSLVRNRGHYKPAGCVNSLQTVASRDPNRGALSPAYLRVRAGGAAGEDVCFTSTVTAPATPGFTVNT